MLRLLMSNGKAAKRLNALANWLTAPLRPLCSDGSVSIGDVSIRLKKPSSPELVPVKYISGELSQYVLKNLRWIMQKDKLGQDVFLIGAPGPSRRLLAMQYLELTKREIEYIALSRDTTESDLKQRREILSGTAYYVDQCAVRAATEGRVLMLEGIEKAERNVLPVLNNLLENREMQLEDGRFLMAAERYDALLKEHSEEELKEWKLVRVSEDFRVIALGLPVPRYHGNPLDPPLRSRFQARDIHLLPFKDQLALLQSACPHLPQERLAQLASFAHTLQSTELASIGLSDFPIHNLVNIVRIMDINPKHSLEELIHRMYPHELMLGDEGQKVVQDALKTFNLNDREKKSLLASVGTINKFTAECSVPMASVEIGTKKWNTVFETPAGSNAAHMKKGKTGELQFVMTKSHSKVLADMLESHSVHDFCLVGPKGCGKSVLVQQFADFLGYNIEPVVLYQDMTARDLLQQRITLASGDTSWRYSPLVMAMLEGSIAELDGIHRVNPGTLAVLQRLISERELSLYDGTRLLHHDRYKMIKEENSWTDQDLTSRGILCIHPSFRIIGLAEPPVVGSSQQQWLNSELLSMFLFHHVRPLSKQEEAQVIYDMVPGCPRDVMDKLLNLTDKLRSSIDPTVSSIASSLSTRQLLRIARRLATYPAEDLEHSIHKACLARFLPRLAASSLEKVLDDSGIHINRDTEPQEASDFVCEIKEGKLHIGQTTASVYNPENRTKVPDVLFYENHQHLNVMEDMLKDFMLGEHLLLVGNQGVGKNKIADRFLHLLNRPREYIQLHRDTTVQSLTLQPNVQDGVIIYEDSPLVHAVKFGHVLVVDEADKAPTHVTCILKSLVENGVMVLGDGRRIVTGDETTPLPENAIRAHPDFRMIVLANRPGFPFLGNDFFGSLGDIFSCHAVDNPDFESEMSMLRQYGPSVPEELLHKLVNAFGELRSRADQGLISYPYSTREVVSVVKHLQAFPNEGLANVVRNVFDFDSYHPEVKEVVTEVMHKHGIPVGASTRNVNLSKEFPLPKPTLVSTWQIPGDENGFNAGINCPVEEKRLKIRGPASISVTPREIERINSRSYGFSEQVGHWDLPMHEGGVVMSTAVGPGGNKGDWIHILAFNPVSLYSQQTNQDSVWCLDLYDLFPRSHYAIPQLKMAALGGDLQGQVLIHEQDSNALYLLSPAGKELRTLNFKSIVDNTKERLTRHFSVEKGKFVMSSEFAHENMVVIYQQDSNKMDVVDLVDGTTQQITLPFIIGQFHPFSRDLWFVGETGTDRKYLLTKPYPEAPVPCVLHPITSINLSGEENDHWKSISTRSLPPGVLSSAVGEEKRSRSNRLLVGARDYATVAVAQPDQLLEKSPVSFYSFKREKESENNTEQSERKLTPPMDKFISEDTVPPLCLPATAQVVRLVPGSTVPKSDDQIRKEESDDEDPRHVRPQSPLGYLEVADVGRRSVRYIPFPGRHDLSLYARLAGKPLVMAPTTYEGIVTVDVAGRVRLWETGISNLVRSLGKWKGLIGDDYHGPLQVNYSRESGEDVTSPKHGKVDPNNAPHVGGNTWAGGTGGRDTAGLGGKGGPYRLDAGHDVHQLSDEEKDAVPDDVKRAAREMGQRAFKQRLREIQMSEYDAEMYESFSSRVRRQVQSLRVILDSLQARGKERVWLRNQTSGELDDGKLIEGLTGERAIYKKRGEEDPELGTPQRLPKRLRFVVDVSGSMYRFNSLDGRLGRMMEAACLVMEAFHQYDNKIKYDIVGHSGDSPEIPFVSHDAPPKNNKERLDIMKQMHAHAQYCWSGDHTLEATDLAITRITEQEADDYFVVVLSDANLERYGIPAEAFGKALTSDARVNAFAIFIGSLGNQADRLVKKLPPGKAFVCMDTKHLPQVLQQIFTAAMLNST